MNQESERLSFPDKWGEDKLSEYFHSAIGNLFETFKLRKLIFPLQRVEDQFCTATNAIEKGCADRFWEAQFLFRAHSAFRGACLLCCSTIVPESFVLMRNCLECSLYALRISKRQESKKIWINRHESNNDKEDARNEFSFIKIKKTIQDANPELAKKAVGLYERLIDLGAHPNPLAFLISREYKEIDSGAIIGQKYLTNDPHSMMLAIKEAIITGMVSLSIFNEIFYERFKVVGIHDYLSINRKLII